MPQRHSAQSPTAVSLWDLCERLIELGLRDHRASAAATRQLLQQHVLPEDVAKLPAHLITPAHLAGLLTPLVRRGEINEANRLRSRLSAAFELAISHSISDRALGDRPSGSQIGCNPLVTIARITGDAGVKITPLLSECEFRIIVDRLQAGLHSFPAHAAGCRLLLLALNLAMQRGESLLRLRHESVDEAEQSGVIIHLQRRQRGAWQPLPVRGDALAHLQWFRIRSRTAQSPWVFASRDPSGPLRQELLYRAVRVIDADLHPRDGTVAPLTVKSLRDFTAAKLRQLGVSAAAQQCLLDRGRTQAMAAAMNTDAELAELEIELGRWQSWLVNFGRTKSRQVSGATR